MRPSAALPVLGAALCALLSSPLGVSANPVITPDIPLTERELSSMSELELRSLLGDLFGNRFSPSGTYAPEKVDCPPVPSNVPGGNVGYVRSAASKQLNTDEANYVQAHRQASQAGWQQFLSAASPGAAMDAILPGGASNYTSDLDRLPRVGLAVSGGGYRAMLFGAGAIQALDGRNDTASSRGTGGLLRLASHAAGLSGGSWAVGSLALSSWAQPQTLLTQVWNLSTNLVIPQDGKVSYYTDIVDDVGRKKSAGFDVTITDYWGRALSYHLVNSSYPNEGQATTWSDIVNTSAYASNSYPFPVVIADQRAPERITSMVNDTIMELSPVETGSWDAQINAFFPTPLLGSEVNNGEASDCYVGYENAGWVMGTSSSLFSSLYAMTVNSSADGVLKDAIQGILSAVSDRANDVSILRNPFRGYSQSVSPDSPVPGYDELQLVDSGALHNIPLSPLVQPARGLDVILAVDASADLSASSWPNGSSLYQSSLRYGQAPYTDIPFPKIPKPETFINRGLNTRPTFFGCRPESDTVNGNATSVSPIIVYVPNYPWQGLSNTSTFKLDYQLDEAQTVLDAGFDAMSFGGRSVGGQSWSTCLSCAMLDRSFRRSSTPIPSTCQECLDMFCWDGTSNDTALPADQPYSPPVGAPMFATSNGTQQTVPPSTGVAEEQNASTQSNGAGVARLSSQAAIVGVVVVGAATILAAV